MKYQLISQLTISCLLGLFLTGCGGGGESPPPDGGQHGGNVGSGSGISCTSPDTDDDGLNDCYEEEIGTSIVDTDTDGDGLSDFKEVVTLAFDPDKNNYHFNPLIADIPRLSFELTSIPDITISYGASEETSTTEGVQRTSEFATSQTTSTTETNTTSIEQTHEGGAGLSSGGLSLSYSYSHSTTEEHSFSWSESQTTENRQAYTSALDKTSASGMNYTNGGLAVTMRITNNGYQTVTLTNLSLSAVQTDPYQPDTFSPVSNLDFDTSFSQFPVIDIEPQSSTRDTLTFETELDLGTALSLLKDSSNLVIQASTWRVEDDQGRSLAHNITHTKAKDAMIVIDYGPHMDQEHGRRTEKYLVATNAKFDKQGITARKALNDILRIPYTAGTAAWDYDNDGIAEASTQTGLTSVRGIETNYETKGHWLVLYQRIDASIDPLNKTTTINYPTKEPYNFDDIVLKGDNVLHLVYVEDRDNDGLAAREEFLHNSSDYQADTDKDGISDYDEVHTGWQVYDSTVYSRPALADTDNDGLLDGQERAAGTDPLVKNTDGDGYTDYCDPEPLIATPGSNDHVLCLAMNDLQSHGNHSDTTDGSPAAYRDDPNHAKVYGAVLEQDRRGSADGALQFDGADDYVVIEENIVQDEVLNAYSFSVWFNPTLASHDNGQFQSILAHANYGDTDLRLAWDNGEIIMMRQGHIDLLLSSSGHSLNTWYHIVGVVEDTNSDEGVSYKLYVNGKLVGQQAVSTHGLYNSSDNWWYIGRSPNYGAFRGSIDDVHVYRHTAFTDAEVKAIYQAQKP